MLCSLNVAPLLQRWGVAGVKSVFIAAVLTEGLRCSAHVLTYAEGHINMKLHADQAEAAG